MNGVLHCGKRWLHHSWWNDFEPPTTSGGQLYYRIPYTLEPGYFLTQEMIDDIEKIVIPLFKRNPDYEHCQFCMSVLGNKSTTSEYVTACVITDNKEFYDKYGKKD